MSRRFPSRASVLFESLEARQLLSASVATLVLQNPAPPNLPVQIDTNDSTTSATNIDGLASALDIRVRIVPGGLFLNVAASSADVMPLAPTGTISIFDGSSFLATVALGHSIRSTLALPPGQHILVASYSGDEHFLPSDTTQTVFIQSPPSTTTPVATNDSGERIRPQRLLSNTNYFDAHQMSVGALPPPPPPADPTDPNPPFPGSTDPTPTPSQRFANVSFSVKLPKLHVTRPTRLAVTR